MNIYLALRSEAEQGHVRKFGSLTTFHMCAKFSGKCAGGSGCLNVCMCVCGMFPYISRNTVQNETSDGALERAEPRPGFRNIFSFRQFV